MRIKPIYIQLIGDAAIPLLGFFVWDWSLYFILLFYLLDLLTSEVFVHFKTRKIVQSQGVSSMTPWIMNGFFSLVILLVNVFLFHLGTHFITPEIDFNKEFIAFLTYEDMGIQQAYFLLPLVVFIGYQQYKLEFIRLRKFEQLTFNDLWRDYFAARIIIGVYAILLTVIAVMVGLPAWVYLVLIVLGSAFYQLFWAFSSKPSR